MTKGNPIEFSGRIFAITEKENVSKKETEFWKRALVLEITGQNPNTGATYVNYLNIEFAGAQVDKTDGFAVGQMVTVRFALTGHLYNSRCYNTLNGFSISPLQPVQAPVQAPVQQPVQQAQYEMQELPF